VDSIADYFARVYQERMTCPDPRDIDWIRRFQSRWGIYRDSYELWEVEFAWFDDTFMTARKTNFAYWRTTPVGTIAYIDEYDLPIADHYARAKAIVAAGSAFAIVGDVNVGELRIFRSDSITRHTNDVRIPEWSWFDIPVKARWEA
jgi:hypothetical protein